MQPVARFHAPGDIRVDDEPRLPFGPREVLGVALQAVDLEMIVLDVRGARPKGLTLVLCRRMTAADHDRTMVDAA